MENTDPGARSGSESSREFPAIEYLAAEVRSVLRSLQPPPEVRDHFRNARIEILKGVREAINMRIAYLEQSRTRGTKINVE